jgi:hypothetical protein
MSINCLSLSLVSSPKCIILRYYENKTQKYRKRVLPIRHKLITDHNIDGICDQLIERHKLYLESVSRKHIIQLLRLLSSDKQIEDKTKSNVNINKSDDNIMNDKSMDELSVFEDDEEFVF